LQNGKVYTDVDGKAKLTILNKLISKVSNARFATKERCLKAALKQRPPSDKEQTARMGCTEGSWKQR
jgi:hypothetical protein